MWMQAGELSQGTRREIAYLTELWVLDELGAGLQQEIYESIRMLIQDGNFEVCFAKFNALR